MNNIPKFIEDLKAEGQEIVCLEDGELRFFFRKPSVLEGLYFIDTVGKSGSMTKSKEKFIRTLFVGENISEFDIFLKLKPFAMEKIVFMLTKSLGSDVNFTMAKV